MKLQFLYIFIRQLLINKNQLLKTNRKLMSLRKTTKKCAEPTEERDTRLRKASINRAGYVFTKYVRSHQCLFRYSNQLIT